MQICLLVLHETTQVPREVRLVAADSCPGGDTLLVLLEAARQQLLESTGCYSPGHCFLKQHCLPQQILDLLNKNVV